MSGGMSDYLMADGPSEGGKGKGGLLQGTAVVVLRKSCPSVRTKNMSSGAVVAPGTRLVSSRACWNGLMSLCKRGIDEPAASDGTYVEIRSICCNL